MLSKKIEIEIRVESSYYLCEVDSFRIVSDDSQTVLSTYFEINIMEISVDSVSVWLSSEHVNNEIMFCMYLY